MVVFATLPPLGHPAAELASWVSWKQEAGGEEVDEPVNFE